MARNNKAATWAVACASLVGSCEGLALKAYPDKLAHGLPTVCYGETEGVHLGDHYTKSECDALLASKLPRYYSEIASCIHVPISDNEKVAFTSAAYNFGSHGFCRSSIVRKLNAGDHKGACDALLLYDMASGKHIRGLRVRRERERTICLTPDATKPVVIPEPRKIPSEPSPVVHENFFVRLWHWLTKGLL